VYFSTNPFCSTKPCLGEILNGGGLRIYCRCDVIDHDFAESLRQANLLLG